MRVLNDFYCPACDETREKLVDNMATKVACHCGADMVKIMATPNIRLDGTDPAFPSAYDRWATIREQKSHLAKRNKE